jgi:DNA-binding PadR family transcriptional regulator
MHQHSTRPAGEAGSPQEGCGRGPRHGFWHHGPRGPHGHHGPHGHGFGPFGRARRGNVRAAVLSVLADRPMHGYEIMQELQERSGGAWRPSPGSVYPTLQLLEDQGLVKGEDVEGKRVFSLTDEGRAEADAVKARPGEAPWESGAGDDPRFKLRQAVFQVAGAAKQVGAGGSAEQVQEALAILTETRRRIYQLLADGE